MTGAPDPVRLEPSAGQHDTFGGNLLREAAELDHHAGHAEVGVNKVAHPRVVANLDAGLFRSAVELVDQPTAAADRRQRRTAPKGDLAIDLQGLTAESRQAP